MRKIVVEIDCGKTTCSGCMKIYYGERGMICGIWWKPLLSDMGVEIYRDDQMAVRLPQCIAAEEEYKRLKGAEITAEILSDPKAVADIKQGIEDIKSGNMVPRAEAKLTRLIEALRGLLVMMDRGPKPQKLDEALTWKENDELARRKAEAALKEVEGE